MKYTLLVTSLIIFYLYMELTKTEIVYKIFDYNFRENNKILSIINTDDIPLMYVQYMKFEHYLNKKDLENLNLINKPSSNFGKVNYYEKLDVVLDNVKLIINNLIEKKIIISKEYFNKNYNGKEWVKMNGKFNASRVFGANAINNIMDSYNIGRCRALEQLIIVNDLNDVKFEIAFHMYPYISTIYSGENEGSIYMKKLDKNKMKEYSNLEEIEVITKILTKHSFNNFKKRNIILCDDVYYVINTNIRNFDIIPEQKYQGFFKYIYHRFVVLTTNFETYQSFHLDTLEPCQQKILYLQQFNLLDD